MKNSSRRRAAAGLAAGAVLAAAPLIALLGSPGAHAEGDLVTLGPYTYDGYTDVLTYNSTSYAFDSYLTTSVDTYPVDLDVYSGAPGSGDYEVLLTIPLLYQGGFADVDGTITPISTFDSADFVSPDVGLADLGGTPVTSDVVSLGPYDLDGYEDTFSVNTETLAIDNFVTGDYNAVPFDLDFAGGAPGSDSSEILLTVPSLFQVGLDDVAGTLTPIYSFDAADFINPDIGLAGL